jgi:hypothetical protein
VFDHSKENTLLRGLRSLALALFVVAGTVGLFFLGPFQLEAAPDEQSRRGWPFGSAQEMTPEIARLFGCTLEQTPRESYCMSRRTRGLVSVDIDPMHAEAAKFTAMVLVSRDDRPNPEEERASVDTAMQVMDYFFPDWDERRTWMNLALQQARDRHANSTIKLGDTVLSVEYEIPLGFPEQSTFAFITIEQAMPR